MPIALYSFRHHLTLGYTLLLSLLLLNEGSFAQEGAYQLKSRREVPLLVTGVVGVASGVLLRNQRDPLSPNELGQLNTNDILAFDRGAASNYSPSARRVSDGLIVASLAMPLISLAFDEARSEAGTLGVMLLEVLILNETLTGLTKGLVDRPRPYTYNTSLPVELRTGQDDTFSFFSGHTSHSAALAFFTARVISAYTERPAVRMVAWAGAALLPAATGWMRYEAGKHFPTDVVVGYAVGASVGLLIPYLHRTNGRSKRERAVRVVPHGLGVAVVFQ